MTRYKEGALDLEACEHEPIAYIGAVQSPYAIAIFEPQSRQLKAVSENLATLVDCTPAELAGSTVSALLADWPAGLDRADALEVEAIPAQTVNGLPCIVRLRPVGSDRALVIDPEPRTEAQITGFADVMRFNSIVEAALSADRPDMTRLSTEMARAFRAISDFDRVMVYRFDTDWNGEVIAEEAAENLDQRFLGLTFPSSDIPKPARDLFLKNRVRPLVDAQAAPSPILAFDAGDGTAFDIGSLPERAVSPIHLAYLENMGVRSTLNIAIIVADRLWGLLSCHHYAGARKLSPLALDLCRVICELLSHGLTRIENRAVIEVRNLMDAFARTIRAAAQSENPPEELQDFFICFEDEILDLIGATGARLEVTDQVVTLGAPIGDVGFDLQARLHARMSDEDRRFFVTHQVAMHHEDLVGALLPGCAGVAFARHASDESCLMAWRPAQPRLETWAGDPLKRVTGLGRLSPRSSFELWQQQTADKSAPWPRETSDRCKVLLAILSEVAWTLNRRHAERAAHRARREAEEAKADLEYAALHDALTELPNRRHLETFLNRIQKQAIRPGARIAALHFDLDRFKSINDTLGHAAGDIALQHVARILLTEKRETDFVSRIGGDEFLLIACERIDEMALSTLSERIISEFSKPLSIEGEVVHFAASIGIAYEPCTGFDPAELLSRADIALYEAKRKGGGRFCFVSDEMEQERIERLKLGEDVQRGFAEGEFEMYFQLQFAAGSRAVAGAEALLRWHHPLRGTLTPYAFLEAAEDVGLLGKLDAFAMDSALAAHARWAAAGFDVPRINVNVSSRRLQELNVASLVAERPEMIQVIAFELLESIDLNAMDPVSRRNVEKIREAGIPLVIDDFGTGHTSILSLTRMRPNRIKIDKDLVIPAVEGGPAREILRSIVTIAHSLGIEVTAEGVETERHAVLMEELGCDVLQGFGLARPQEVEAVLKKHQMSALE